MFHRTGTANSQLEIRISLSCETSLSDSPWMRTLPLERATHRDGAACGMHAFISARRSREVDVSVCCHVVVGEAVYAASRIPKSPRSGLFSLSSRFSVAGDSETVLMSVSASVLSAAVSDGAHAARSAFTRGRSHGSAMKMTSKPNPSHQKTDMVSSTGKRAMGSVYVKKPQRRMRTARAAGL